MNAPPVVNPKDLPVDPGAGASGLGRMLRRAYRRTGPYFVRYGTLVAFGAVVLAFSLARPDSFATWENWKSILNLGSVVMVMAAVLTVPMIMNDFDLSIGYNTQLLGAFAIVAVAN